MIEIKTTVIPPLDDLLALYNDVGWTVYTVSPHELQQVYEASLSVITAWDGPTLVGALRCVGDGISIVYIQDLWVLRAYQRQGIGRALLAAFDAQHHSIWQKVLLADNTEENQAFYRACGYLPSGELDTVAFIRMKNMPTAPDSSPR